MWHGDLKFLLTNLILKDFRIRYRNMSLGVFWSLLNPLVMMSLFSIVFTMFLPSPAPDFPVFLLCGIVPFNFFSIAWATGSNSIIDNAGLIKRVPVPREIMPVASVLSVLIHTLIQLGLLIVMAAIYHKFPNVNWLFIPFVFLCLSIFACGMSLLFSGINVYIRDTRYVVESGNTILFWLVPIVYPLTVVPPRFRNIYLWNPLVPMIEALRAVILTASAPSMGLIVRMVSTSVATLIIGWLVFRALKPRFYNYL